MTCLAQKEEGLAPTVWRLWAQKGSQNNGNSGNNTHQVWNAYSMPDAVLSIVLTETPRDGNDDPIYGWGD